MRVEHNVQIDEQQPVKQSFCRSLRRDTHWKCLILSLLVTGCLAAITWCRLTVVKRVIVSFYSLPVSHSAEASPCEDGYIYIPVAFVVMLYLVYLVECWHCHTRIELQYKVDVGTVYEKVQAMREAVPIVWWKAVCYHYVRRTRQVTRYRNGDAFTTTQVYYERVNSHTSSSCFNFTTCGVKDISKTLGNLEQFPATKVKFSKGFSFATLEAEQEFEDQRAQFFQEHERRDDYMETREGLDLMNYNFKEYMISFSDPENLPWYVSQIIFWLASAFMLSWPLRVLIEYKTAYVHYHVHKLFGCNYLDSSYCIGQMTRVSTMGSSELELTIRNNYTMVPSYSEALLMDGNSCPNYQTLTGATTPNGSIPLLPVGHTSHAQTNGYLTTRLPNGHIAHRHNSQPTISGPNGYVPHSGGVPARILDSSPSDPVPVHTRRRRRKKRKRRRQSYSETTHAHSDSDGGPRPSSARSVQTLTPSRPMVATPESLSDPDLAALLPSGGSCYEMAAEGGAAVADSTVRLVPAPPPYEDALGMRRARSQGITVSQSLHSVQGESPHRPDALPSVHRARHTWGRRGGGGPASGLLHARTDSRQCLVTHMEDGNSSTPSTGLPDTDILISPIRMMETSL